MDVKQSQKAGNNAIQIQQTVVGDNNYVVGIEIENDSRKPNDNQPKFTVKQEKKSGIERKLSARTAASSLNLIRLMS